MGLNNLTERQILDLTDYNWVKEHLGFKLIHYGRNCEMLTELIYSSFFDLAVVPFLDMTEITGRPAISCLPKVCLEFWEISKEQLVRDAMKNSEWKYPVKFKSIGEILFELPCGFCEDPDDNNTYVLTNLRNTYGAGCMLYDGVLKDCSKRLGGDFYVLPSSVHETILIPEYAADSQEELIRMVCEVNCTLLKPTDVLSDQIYKYISAKNILCQLQLSKDADGRDKVVALDIISLDRAERNGIPF